MIITDNKIKNLTYSELKNLIISLYPIGLSGFIKYCRTSKSTLYKVSEGRRWNEILKDCNLDIIMNKPNSYTEEDVINDVIEFRNKCSNERIKFSSTTYRRFGKFSQTIIDSKFGGWNSIINIIDNNSSEKDYIKTIIINFENKCINNGTPFNANTFKRGRPGISYLRINKVFGSWKSALEYCGIYEKYHTKILDTNPKIGKSRIKNRDENLSLDDFKISIDSFIKSNNPDHIIDIYKAGFSKHNILKAFKNIESFYKKYPNIKRFVKSNAEEDLFFILSSKGFDFIREFPGPNINGRPSRFDYYIKDLNMIIEIHGEQHYSKNRLFHKDNEIFQKRVLIDNLKMNWAYSNGYKYVILPYDSVDENMLNLIINAKF